MLLVQVSASENLEASKASLMLELEGQLTTLLASVQDKEAALEKVRFCL